jgi:hypothetical protein
MSLPWAVTSTPWAVRLLAMTTERQRRSRTKHGNVSRTVTRCSLIEPYNELIKERNEFIDEFKMLLDDVFALCAERRAALGRRLAERGSARGKRQSGVQFALHTSRPGHQCQMNLLILRALPAGSL